MSNRSFEQRTERRNRLIGLLRSEYYWQTADLRAELGISQRTLMRELAELRQAGFPIESDRGRGGGVRLQGRWGIERLNLNHQEVIELILALAIVESLQSPLLTGNLTSIKQKLFQSFPHNQRQRVSDIRKRIMLGDNTKAHLLSDYQKPENAVSQNVAEAFINQQLLHIAYLSEAEELTERVIEAQYILLNWPIWYIIAWDHLRQASRVFRIDRIKAAQLQSPRFQLRGKEHFDGIYGPYHQPI